MSGLVERVLAAITGSKAPSRPAAPGQDPLSRLEAYLATISEAHAIEARAARQRYLDLLARLTDHQAAEAPEPAELLALLRAVGKTPEALRDDLQRFKVLRARADLVAAIPATEARARATADALQKLRQRWQRVEKRYAARVMMLQCQAAECEQALDRASQARAQLRADQHVTDEITRARRRRIRPGSYVPDPAQEETEAERRAAEERAIAAIEAGADRLEYLERAFFPPPPVAELASPLPTTHLLLG